MREHFCVCVQVAEAPAADPRLGRSGEIWHRSRICQARRTRRGEVGRLRISQLEVVSSTELSARWNAFWLARFSRKSSAGWCCCARSAGSPQSASRGPLSVRSLAHGDETRHLVAVEDPVRALFDLLGQGLPIVGDAAQRLVAADLRHRQHPVQSFESSARDRKASASMVPSSNPNLRGTVATWVALSVLKPLPGQNLRRPALGLICPRSLLGEQGARGYFATPRRSRRL
jgi:hypothetical protein